MMHLLKSSFSDIKRYKLTFIINLLLVSFIVFILSFVVYLGVNVFKIEKNFLNKTQIIVFLNSETNLTDFISFLQNNKDINSIEVIDKEYLNKIISKSFTNNDLITASIGEIKILRIFINYKFSSKLVDSLKNNNNIEELIFNNLFLDKLFKFLNIVKNSIFIISFFLLIISFILFFYTYRLFAYERLREIKILSYLGASNWFIITPYILSSFFIGTIGSILGVFFYYSFVSIVSISIKSFLGNWISNVYLYSLNNYQLAFIVLTIILIVVFSSFISLMKAINKDA